MPTHLRSRLSSVAVRLALQCCAALLLTFAALNAHAHDYAAGTILVDHPWARATPKGAKVAAGYLRVLNKGTIADRLIAARFARAAAVEIHTMKIENGMMYMNEAKRGFVIEPGGVLELKPGGAHLMLMGLKAPLIQGEDIEGSLTFERAGEVAVHFKIEAIGAAAPAAGLDTHNH